MQLVAKTFFGLESVLAAELEALGAQNIKILKRAVEFEGDTALLYRANLELRSALRILIPIRSFKARSPEELYRQVLRINWSKYMSVDDTFAINGTVYSQTFTHSRFAALKTKDAIADQFRRKSGRRPSVDIRFPNLRIDLYIYEQQCTISLDSSGESLHKRAYRASSTIAPINEALAAGMLLFAGWKGDQDFMDPMCGSGTFLIEAAMIAGNIAPQAYRKDFGFMRWPDFDKSLWSDILHQEKKNRRTFDCTITGSDKDFQAIKSANANVFSAELEGKINIERLRLDQVKASGPKGMMMMNPPYDLRLQDADINELYKSIGDQLKQQFAGWEAWIISSNIGAMKKVGLRPSAKYQLFNGPLECKFHKYEMYAGKKEET